MRGLLISVLLLTGLGAASASPVRLDPEALIAPTLLSEALEARARQSDRVTVEDVMIVVDYGLRSDVARLFVVDLETGRVEAFRVAHGSGSDPDHDGYLDRFSSVPGSLASPAGAFLTAEEYSGQHKRSLRLDGLDGDNANARDRYIVMHAAWYAEPEFLKTHGKLGRSQGCIVFSARDRDALFDRLKPGTFLYVGRSRRAP